MSLSQTEFTSLLKDPEPFGTSCLEDELATFDAFGTPTQVSMTTLSEDSGSRQVPVFLNEFWTAEQRQASSLHEVSYRACFKPQLPGFFIQRLTQRGDIVYDPFMGRGTTPVETALLRRIPWANDINPLSITFTRPRLTPPKQEEVVARLDQIDLGRVTESPPEDLLVFYHPDTLQEIEALKDYFLSRKRAGDFDNLDEWLCMVAVNRLTGHSAGFFSVYTMPPNQAVSVKSQIKINARRNQVPPRRDVRQIILKKSKQLLGDVGEEARDALWSAARHARLTTEPAESTPQLPPESVSLVVTSPPFLNVVQYATDNWLRCWFLGIDAKAVEITVPAKLEAWQTAMTRVFRELHRLLKVGGHVAFEVGEVHKGNTRLEDAVLPCGIRAGLSPRLILINVQEFTKTANCWGVDNNSKGTNSNRIVLFRKP